MFPPLDTKEQPATAPWSVQPPSTTTNPPIYNTLQLDGPQSICLDDHHYPNRPSVVYVTPANYEQEIDYPPRGRRPSTNALPPSDYQPSTYLPSSSSPNADGRRSISQSDFEMNRPSPDVRIEPRFEEVEVNGTQYLVNPDMFSAEDFEALRDNNHEPHDSQELQSGRSSNLSRAVVPSSAGDGGKDADVDREEYQLNDAKAGNDDEPRSLEQTASILGDIVGVGSNPSVSLDHRNTKDQAVSAVEYPTMTPSDSSLARQAPETSLIAKESTASNPQIDSCELPQATKTPRVYVENIVPHNPIISTKDNDQQGTSLLGSRLPINPAQITQAPAAMPAVKAEKPPNINPFRIPYLLDSILPINPASSLKSHGQVNSIANKLGRSPL